MRCLYFLFLFLGFACASAAQNENASKITLRANDFRIKIDGPRIPASTPPLVFVDDIETDMQSLVLNPSNIESITILKDASATSLHSSRSINGVIVIKTKPGTAFFTINDFVNKEKNASVQKVKLNDVVLSNMKNLLVEKTALKQTMISSDFKLDENCKAVLQDTLVVMTAPGNLQ